MAAIWIFGLGAAAAVVLFVGAAMMSGRATCGVAGRNTTPRSDAVTGAAQGQAGEAPAAGSGVLELLGISPSDESIDYVRNKTQFQLHTLLTEQRHPKTWDLGERIKTDTLAGLGMLSAVDEDIRVKLDAMAGATADIEAAAGAVEAAIRGRRKIYVYGCGATGRLAKQMESAFWRPFWEKVRADDTIWAKLSDRVSATVEGDLIGEMTGADRALISSLEGFEDLQLIGRLQLEDRGISRGDVVIGVTEGGETSSVIGTILAAHDQWKVARGYDPAVSRGNLYFIYNNPDEKLLPFERSRRVLEEPGITKINLTTGPQAITGSTRMQATTIETYVVGTVLEAALARVLGESLSPKEMGRLGFRGRFDIASGLREFGAVLKSTRRALPDLARLTDAEAATYAAGRRSTYFADRGLITVFIDSTERSPTFRLFPLDTLREPQRRSWIQVWAAADTGRAAWRAFLHRPFRGLAADFYRPPFETAIDDPYLRRAALESLKKAGHDQQDLYDFSFEMGGAVSRRPKPGDLGVLVAFSPEEAEFARPGSYFRRFMHLCASQGAALGVIVATDLATGEAEGLATRIVASFESAKDSPILVLVEVSRTGDPFGLKQQIAVKMLLNAHSTAVMAKLGKVVGNTMTNVSPSNLKLIGRATYLILSHVNDVLARPAWRATGGRPATVTYAEANAVLYDSIATLKGKTQEAGQTAEVALSIVRILESLRLRHGVGRDEALAIVRDVGLADYLAKLKTG
jgi:N-acetylmuramic acid 6-phosphate etherase